jgi:hypothetical protein
VSSPTADRHAVLTANAARYAAVAVANIHRECPSDVRHLMRGPGDFPHRPRDRNPVFHGSYDWHSSVEMHWLLVRLLRVAGEHVPGERLRAVLDAQLTADALRAEARFVADPAGGPGLRPYGWGWALSLVHEVSALAVGGDDDAARWAPNLRPLADAITERLLDWLPRQTYPVRYGVHVNSAFGLSRSLPHAADLAAAGDRALLDAITAAAHRWYGADTDYPGGWEPSGSDFLSGALVEAELMASVLPAGRFAPWLDAFLPGLAAGEPAALFTPAVVADSTDGQIAHLHGLNASRAWCWWRLASELPAIDPRIEPMLAAAAAHADAALPHVVGSDYVVEHWLPAFAVLMLS